MDELTLLEKPITAQDLTFQQTIQSLVHIRDNGVLDTDEEMRRVARSAIYHFTILRRQQFETL